MSGSARVLETERGKIKELFEREGRKTAAILKTEQKREKQRGRKKPRTYAH